MREIRMSSLMSGDGKRGAATISSATAPILDSTKDQLWVENGFLIQQNLTNHPWQNTLTHSPYSSRLGGKMFRKLQFLASRSVILVGLSIFTVAYAGLSQAHGQCRNHQDQLTATQNDPRYPALQKALDSYF